MGAVEGVFEQLLRPLRLGYASVEFADLAFGKPAPASAAAQACGQQLTDLFEREPRVLPEANESNTLGGRGGVMPSPAGALAGRKETDPLVVAQRRRRRSGAPGQLADGEQGVLVWHRFPLDLKCASTCMVGDRRVATAEEVLDVELTGDQQVGPL
jgi:hypothetical protein